MNDVLAAQRARVGRPGRTAGHRDRGLATVAACVGALAVIAVLVVGVRIGAATIARHRAEAAADLGALAGATRAVSGEAAGCGRADTVVRANRARMLSCRADGLDLLVQVVVTLDGGGSAEARARAGPLGSP